MVVHGKEVKGSILDEQSRCGHYHAERDIVAIKFACCQTWYPCFRCHEDCADHEPRVWERSQFDERAVLCGNCGYGLTINEYLQAESACPNCGADFNPFCEGHYGDYFRL